MRETIARLSRQRHPKGQVRGARRSQQHVAGRATSLRCRAWAADFCARGGVGTNERRPGVRTTPSAVLMRRAEPGPHARGEVLGDDRVGVAPVAQRGRDAHDAGVQRRAGGATGEMLLDEEA